jgi:hypothetical protein
LILVAQPASGGPAIGGIVCDLLPVASNPGIDPSSDLTLAARRSSPASPHPTHSGSARAGARRAPPSDLLKNGTSIHAADGDKCTIATGQHWGTTSAFSDDSLADGDYLELEIEQVGSGTAGTGLVCVVELE